jgi:DNA helicase-2/ATP-dependent DNA helicase PcrA
MTRAKDELDLIVPQRLFMYQQNGHDSGYVNSKMSRFIPKSIHHAFELKHWSEPGTEPRSSKSKWRRQRLDVASRVEEMWR